MDISEPDGRIIKSIDLPENKTLLLLKTSGNQYQIKIISQKTIELTETITDLKLSLQRLSVLASCYK